MNLTNTYIEPDRWNTGEKLKESDGYSDSSFPGCQYRIPAGFDGVEHRYQLAVNISISGRKSHQLDYGRYKTRVKIEWVGDGEPSTFSRGWVYTDSPLI